MVRYFPVDVIVFCCYVIVFFGSKEIGMIRYFPVPFLLEFFGISAAFVWRKTLFRHHLLFQASVSFLKTL